MKWLISLCLLLRVFTLVAQEWSEPIEIANLTGSSGQVDFYISATGTIHCVWAQGVEPFTVVYLCYSKSIDNGLTWSTPENVSDNTEDNMLYPEIVADTNDNVYIAYICQYAPELTSMKFRSKVNGYWGDISDLAPGQNMAGIADLVIDNDDRICAIWYSGGDYGSTYYRFLQNGVWSNILSPYPPDSNVYMISDCVVDAENNIHCAGSIRYPGDSIYSVRRLAYFNFNTQTGLWSPPVDFGFTYCYYRAIDLDNADNPRIVWREEILQEPIGIYYTFSDGFNWSQPLMIMNNNGQDQCIQVDSTGTTHLVQNETVGIGSLRRYQLSYHTSNDWAPSVIVPPVDALGLHKLQYHNNTLYLVYSQKGPDNNANVYLKTKLLSSVAINEQTIDSTPIPGLIRTYPNPAKQQVNIEFQTNNQTHLDIDVFNQRGQCVKTIYSGSFLPGQHNLTWDGTDNNSQRIANGIYILRLRSETGQHIRKILFEK